MKSLNRKKLISRSESLYECLEKGKPDNSVLVPASLNPESYWLGVDVASGVKEQSWEFKNSFGIKSPGLCLHRWFLYLTLNLREFF